MAPVALHQVDDEYVDVTCPSDQVLGGIRPCEIRFVGLDEGSFSREQFAHRGAHEIPGLGDDDMPVGEAPHERNLALARVVLSPDCE